MSNPNLQRIVAYLCLIHHNEEAWGSLAEAEGGAVPAEYQPPRRISGGGGLCGQAKRCTRQARSPPSGSEAADGHRSALALASPEPERRFIERRLEEVTKCL